MPSVPAGLIGEISIPRAEDVALPSRPSEIECEVIRLFDRFRDSLLRYVLSFGLSVQDGEEIIQEVFLALFGHLRAGKSRRSLSGWIFCVAHNLALKRRHATQRLQNEIDTEGKLVESQVDPSPNPEAVGTVRPTAKPIAGRSSCPPGARSKLPATSRRGSPLSGNRPDLGNLSWIRGQVARTIACTAHVPR